MTEKYKTTLTDWLIGAGCGIAIGAGIWLAGGIAIEDDALAKEQNKQWAAEVYIKQDVVRQAPVETVETVAPPTITELPVPVITAQPVAEVQQVQEHRVEVVEPEVVPEVQEVVEVEDRWMGLPPCEYEDSDNCYWDAQSRGNGIGDSFIVINGVVEYK